jgi:hypothetical protein
MSVMEGWLWQVPFAFALWIAVIGIVLYKKK